MAETKLATLREFIAREDWESALRLANSFPRLGPQKEAIQKAWAAMNNAQFYFDLGEDPEQLVLAGIDALKRRYGEPPRKKSDAGSRVGVYLRVSTDDQESGIESQASAIRGYLDGHGIADAIWYRDRISGARDKRPGLERLERDIFNGRVKTVIVWRLDRLSRGGILPGLTLLGKWLEKGVRVVSVTEQFDFYGPTGEIFAAFCFAIARMFRVQLIENTKRGMNAARRRGAKFGKRPRLFAKDILPLLERGMSLSDIARQLSESRKNKKPYCRQAIYDALRRGGVDLSTVRGLSGPAGGELS